MASVKTQLTEFYVDETTTTPVILGDHVVGRDYILKRVKTTGTNCFIRALVKFETDDMDEVDVSASNGIVNGIIPDTIFNRRQLEKDNNADWSYSLKFSSGTEIEIAIPINNIIVSLVLAEYMTINLTTALESAGSGYAGVQATSGVAIGKPLCSVTSGTGTQVIAAVLYGMMTNTVKA